MTRGSYPGRAQRDIEHNRLAMQRLADPPPAGSCFYCAAPVEAGQDIVRGVEAVAHRSCIRAETLERLRDKYPEKPPHLGRSKVILELRETGFSEADMLWDAP